ncbi:SDR family NAD(P)-dependent oxidoreductase [Arvimicrobium flavum]|uniref:SDR family NAD(P)-dependent oxidoreductase n=1 Tax=Arvimicrobium flavum TaxID=3393320 RepID=UPI00237AF2E4|nr:SDR family NAD(P)-dependent oxidoreductase [Mesorhizobium shangrilense]
MAALNGTVSVVFGASQGIGAEIARALARDGSAIVAASRRLDAVTAVADAIRRDGGRAEAVACDVADPHAVDRTIETSLATFGRLDHVVNNAGVIDPIAPITETEPAKWALAARVNIAGTYHGSRAALRAFGAGGRGVIVNLSSGAAHKPLEGWSAYCAAKAAALALLRCLALETEGTAVRVYGFQPGAVDTGMLDRIRDAGMGYVAGLSRDDLLPPELPARVVAWLMRPEAADLAGGELSIRDAALRARVGLPERHYA